MELRAKLSATQCKRDLSTLITECSCTLELCYLELPEEEVLHLVDASVLEGYNFIQMHMERRIAIP